MRSPRRWLEWACRVGAFALLGWMLGQSIVPTPGRALDVAPGSAIAARLPDWTRAPSSVSLHATFASAPNAWIVDWLAALGHSGHPMTWSGSPPAVAISAAALVDPQGGARIDVAAPAGESVALRDAAGPLDSLRIANLGASVTTPLAAGSIGGVARAGAQSFSTTAPPLASIRPILVVGGAGWEGRFVVAALQERGWPVITKFSVAPKIDIADGAATPLDTSRVAAVVAIDSSALARLGGESVVARYVRSGGGLVLAGTAALAANIGELAPGKLGARVRPPTLPTDTIGLGATGFYPVALAPSGIALERRAGGVAVASRRVGSGRVIAVGYDDSWRWRMAGGPGSDAAHREWWTRVVGSVAYAPPGNVAASTWTTTIAAAASAPLAYLVERAGVAQPAPPRPAGWSVDRQLLLMLMMILLLIEWGSRRLRGLR